MTALPLPILDCADCGKCCTTMGYPPFLALQGDQEWESLPEHLQDEIDDAIHDRRGDRGLPCIWYDAGTKCCTHYELRPDICRDFPAGGADCLRIRAGA